MCFYEYIIGIFSIIYHGMNPTMKRNLEDEAKHKKIDMWYHYYNNINAECTYVGFGSTTASARVAAYRHIYSMNSDFFVHEH